MDMVVPEGYVDGGMHLDAADFRAADVLLMVDMVNMVLFYQRKYAAQVADYLGERGVRCVVEHSRGGNLATITMDYMKRVNADLVAIMSEQGMNIADFVLGSYAQQIFSKSTVPVLCITPRELSLTADSFRTQG